MFNLNKSFVNSIDNRVNLTDKYTFIELTKNECSDILKLANTFKYKTKFHNFLMNDTKLKMLFQEGIGYFKGIFMEFMDTLQKH